MSSRVEDRRVSALYEAVDRLGDLLAVGAIDDPARARLEAVRDQMASYALAIGNLVAAGVAADYLDAVIERGWREAAVGLDAALPHELRVLLGPDGVRLESTPVDDVAFPVAVG